MSCLLRYVSIGCCTKLAPDVRSLRAAGHVPARHRFRRLHAAGYFGLVTRSAFSCPARWGQSANPWRITTHVPGKCCTPCPFVTVTKGQGARCWRDLPIHLCPGITGRDRAGCRRLRSRIWRGLCPARNCGRIDGPSYRRRLSAARAWR